MDFHFPELPKATKQVDQLSRHFAKITAPSGGRVSMFSEISTTLDFFSICFRRQRVNGFPKRLPRRESYSILFFDW